MNEIPNDPRLRALIESGYGRVEYHDHGNIKTGFHFLSLEEIESMGEEERIRLGLQHFYEFALEHQARK